VPKKVEKINDHLFIDTYKSNNIKIRNVCEMKRRSLVNTGDRRYQFRDSLGEYRLSRKGKVKEMSFQLFNKKRG